MSCLTRLLSDSPCLDCSLSLVSLGKKSQTMQSCRLGWLLRENTENTENTVGGVRSCSWSTCGDVGLRGQDRCRPRGGGCVITAVIISDGGSDKWDKMSPGNRLATVAMTAVVVIALNSLLVISFTGWLAVVLECPQSPGGPSTPSLSVSHTLSHCSRHRVCTARSEKSVAV